MSAKHVHSALQVLLYQSRRATSASACLAINSRIMANDITRIIFFLRAKLKIKFGLTKCFSENLNFKNNNHGNRDK
jgi:hypothetical protein